MKVLILSCNAGQGHNSAAKAVAEQLTEMGHECAVKDVLEYISKGYSKFVCGSYVKIVLYTPRAFGATYKFWKKRSKADGMKSFSYFTNMMCCKKMYDDIVSQGFEAVVCTHIFAGQAVTHLKHKYKLELPLYIISTDYSFCPYFNEIDVTKYFIPMEQVKEEFIQKDVPEEKLIPTGIPVSSRFWPEENPDKVKYKKQLELDVNGRYCLMMSGSMGYGDLYELTDRILEQNIPNVHVVVICGNNTKIKKEFDEKYAQDDRVLAIGYTEKVDLYMKASDVVITKPGGLSSTEAMVCNVPLILTKPIPGCETENYELLTSLGTAIGATKTQAAVEKVVEVLTNPDVAENIVNMQRKYINSTSARDIAEYVVKGEALNNELVSKLQGV